MNCRQVCSVKADVSAAVQEVRTAFAGENPELVLFFSDSGRFGEFSAALHELYPHAAVAGAATCASFSPAGACRFGEWYLGDEGRRYEHLPEFEAVGSLHGATHEIAREIVAFAQAGNARMAQSRLEDLRTRHDALISSLHALSAAIANNNRR